MLTKDVARTIALRHLEEMAKRSGMDLTLTDDKTVEFDLGWIFFWSSTRFLQTRDPSHAVAGNAPIIVDRDDGSMHQASTAIMRTQQLIEWYRARKRQAGN